MRVETQHSMEFLFHEGIIENIVNLRTLVLMNMFKNVKQQIFILLNINTITVLLYSLSLYIYITINYS